MSSSFYLEKCIEAVAKIREEDVSSLALGEKIGTGSMFEFRSLGGISLEGVVQLGLKLPKSHRGSDASIRLSQEVAIVEKILEKAPFASDKIPAFMGLLAIEEGNDEGVAIITEDVTDGNRLSIWPVPASWPAELADGLGGGYGRGTDDDVLNRSMAFDVGGVEKWLDFTPSPFGRFDISNPIYEDMYRVNEKQEELTVTITADSPLALSIS